MTLPPSSAGPSPDRRPAYRVPVGLPLRNEGRRQSVVVSMLIHALIITLLLVPIVIARNVITPIEQGAGGAGPAGGGGGGMRGNDGARESLHFVRVAPIPAPTPAVKPAPVPPPVVQPKLPDIPQPKVQEQVSTPAPMQSVSSIPGVGSGRDGAAGAGPGSGGGIGSGIGPGRGSGVGPGSGGGTQATFPPTPVEFFLPPLPPPASVRGFQFRAEFDVDSTGKVLDIQFSQTRDGDYNRRIASVLRSMRFRPGTRADGTPIRMKAQVGYEF